MPYNLLNTNKYGKIIIMEKLKKLRIVFGIAKKKNFLHDDMNLYTIKELKMNSPELFILNYFRNGVLFGRISTW